MSSLAPTATPGRAPANPFAVAWARLWRARRLVERNVLVYRHQWIIIFSGVFEPLFYLLGIGLGIGGVIGNVPPEFVAGTCLWLATDEYAHLTGGYLLADGGFNMVGA